MDSDTATRGALEGDPFAVRICLLGRFEVQRGEAPIPPGAWRRRRPADVLKILALASGHALTRDQVVDTLWPDKDPASGANNLHRALYDLRQILGGRFVDLESGTVSLRAGVWVDVDEFEAAVASGDPAAIERALGLYHGDLAPGDDAAWLAPRRIALRRAFAEAALPLARAASERGERETALPLLRRVAAIRPASEEAQVLLIRVLAEAGRRADALRQYEACALALREARDAPGPEIRALRDAIQRGEIGPREARPSESGWRRVARRLLGASDLAPLRGRAAVVLLLESLVEQGSGALVLLGERGVGKTRLALEGARLAQERGAVVLSGLPGAAGAAPGALLASALSDHARVAAIPGGDPFGDLPGEAGPPEERRRRLFDGVRRAVAAIGGGRPVYLAAEDVHRADETSLGLLHLLARQARALRLMIVATCREDEVRSGSPVQRLLSSFDCERLARGVRVQRLGLAATREQLHDLVGVAPADALAAQVYRVTDGSPFYTEEVGRAFGETGQVSFPEGPAAAVRARVARLGRKAEALLAAAAVAGPRFDLDLVRPMAGLTAHDLLAAADQCLQARLLDEDGGGYHFHHSLAREAIYEGLDPERRVALHRAAARALEATAGPAGPEALAEALAFHHRAGGEPGAALPHLLAAGRRAEARGGPGEALAAYGEALEILEATSGPPPARRDLVEAMGHVQMALGELAGVERSFRGAAAIAGPPGPSARARARRWEAFGLVAAGRAAEAEPVLAAALLDAEDSVAEAAEILLLRSALRWHAGDARAAAALAAEAGARAFRSGDPALAMRADAAARGEFGDVGPATPFDVHLLLLEAALRGDGPPAEVDARVAAFAASARGPRAAAVARAAQGALHLERGRLAEAEVALRDAAERFRTADPDRGDALGEAFALDGLGTALTALGRVEEALAVLGDGVIAAERAPLRGHALTRLHVALARNRLAAGAVYAAEDCVREASQSFARHGACAVCEILLRPEVLRVALARGRLAEADAEVREIEALAARRGGRAALARAGLARGQLLVAQGRAGAAVAVLAEARKAFLDGGAAYDAARCLAAQARALAARDARAGAGATPSEEARRVQAEADQALAALGASAADS